ncbi:McrBC 5-methylcytosine restriction system component [Actinomadura viridis]|uniref:5-methylcytosine-specific restriction enzyme subunit McrC n=1 Tax=Actinomadura viridis TaxID=58110 RepID=A0A931DJ65_9ACTN|nr:hypothetical protein [Actinomadura viridis]MBG6087683.1 5-methylcytosine-specific restriction enzyme subunit McrC [Actinomadura viridis]
MAVVDLKEQGGWQRCTLTREQGDALRSSEFVQVRRQGKHWELKPKDRVVGAFRAGPPGRPVTVRIKPKLPIKRLMFLIGYAKHLHGWREEEVDAAQSADLLPVMAYTFARAADRALLQGVLLGYREKEEQLPVVRGRIREAAQIKHRYGQALPLEVRYDDFTVDTVENRLLLTAAYRLLRLDGIGEEPRKLLRRLILRLDGVTPYTRGTPPGRWTPSRINARYHAALELADLVLRSGSYEHEDGKIVRVDGLVLTMWKVFEDFLSEALKQALRPYGGKLEAQISNHHLDQAGIVRLRPDLVYYAPTGPPSAVADAKYMIKKPIAHRQAHLYQVLAYCTSLNVKRGYLVYAEDSDGRRVHRATGTDDVQIIETSLDLGARLDRLREQIDLLARELAGVDGAAPAF